MDRIDLHIDAPAVPFAELNQQAAGEPSSAIKARVVQARQGQAERLASFGLTTNSQIRSRDLARLCIMNSEAATLLKTALTELRLSGRAYDNILRVARTIADLAESKIIHADHLAEAIQYRSLDRNLWT